MKSNLTIFLPALALAAVASTARAEKEVVLRRLDSDAPHQIFVNQDDGRIEKEKVTYLGIETAPMNRTLGAQLGLPRDVGLIVINVMDKSPAAGLLKEDDVLTRLDDQVLIDMHQLGVLVRARKDGEEVRLTLMRGGKELSLKAKRAVREVPRQANIFFNQRGPGGDLWTQPLLPDGAQGLARLRELPGMGADGAQDVLRMIEHERGNFMSGPGLHIVARGGKGSTIVDLPKSNISYSDDDGSIEIKVDDGKRNLTVKDAKGTVAFDGPITTEEDRKKLSPEIRKRLEKLDSDTIGFDVGDDFKPEVVPLPPQPAKTKIGHRLGMADNVQPGRAAGPF